MGSFPGDKVARA